MSDFWIIPIGIGTIGMVSNPQIYWITIAMISIPILYIETFLLKSKR